MLKYSIEISRDGDDDDEKRQRTKKDIEIEEDDGVNETKYAKRELNLY